MSLPQVHLINHTHWDREWFLTSVYTSRWIPGLIERLEALVAANPDFCYFFDGQTLVIEDLLAVAPEYKGRAHRLVEKGHLLIGPYYCQPDWQITGGEALLRNLYYGVQDVTPPRRAGDTGWLVDTFGHISQSPQMHRQAGIEQVYLWRGVPELEPYFHWQAPDGSDCAGDLFAGRIPQPVRRDACARSGATRLERKSNALSPTTPPLRSPCLMVTTWKMTRKIR
jgi:hypothetical protein